MLTRSRARALKQEPAGNDQGTPETEGSRDLGQLPNKRKRNKQIGASKKTRQRRRPPVAVGEGSSASPAAPVTVSTPPRPVFPPYPKSGNADDVHKWCQDCNRIRQVLAKGCLLNFFVIYLYIRWLLVLSFSIYLYNEC
jgi:hypothetical protein